MRSRWCTSVASAGSRSRSIRRRFCGETAEQLKAYFAGQLTEFDVPLAPPGGSAFERAVWAQIAAIPYGETTTYGEIARAVGNGAVDAARAVGTACNHNPVPVIVPCHRVVGAGGKLVGFGGGLDRKRFLLQLEAPVTDRARLRLITSRHREERPRSALAAGAFFALRVSVRVTTRCRP